MRIFCKILYITRQQLQKNFQINFILGITLVNDNFINETVNNVLADIIGKIKLVADSAAQAFDAFF